MKLVCGERVCEVRVEANAVSLDGRSVPFSALPSAGGIRDVLMDGRMHKTAAVREGGQVLVWCEGRTFSFAPASARPGRAAERAGDLLAPMPGRVRRVLVREGEHVAKGQVVLVLEAMKMEHAILAPRDGVVSRFAHAEGDLVEAGAELAVIEG